MDRKQNPGALAGATGVEISHLSTVQDLYILALQPRFAKPQIRRLMRLHGLTQAQAATYAALIWGAQ